MSKYLQHLRAILEADTDDFSTLLELSGLDPKVDFQYADLSGVNFGRFNYETLNLKGAITQGIRHRGRTLELPQGVSSVAKADQSEMKSLPAIAVGDLAPNQKLLFTDLVFRLIARVRHGVANRDFLDVRNVLFSV